MDVEPLPAPGPAREPPASSRPAGPPEGCRDRGAGSGSSWTGDATSAGDPAPVDPAGADVLPGRIPTRPDSRLRRAADVVGALALLVVAAPFLAVGAAAVRRVAGRPVFFAHRRIGKGGRPFRCWKLRTMEPGAEERLRRDPDLRRRHREHGFKLPEDADPRVIPGTEWLRRSHLDELPQLVNVLRGEMSLVGPRPVVREELICYGEGWRTLLSVRPGIAGAWTAEGARRPPYPERALLELEYVRRAGFATDVGLLVRNLLALLRRRAGG